MDLVDYKEEIEIIKQKAECEFIRKIAYQNRFRKIQENLEITKQNKIRIAKNKRIQKFKIILTISLISVIILLNIMVPDLLAKNFAFGLVLSVIFLIPFTIYLLFGVEDLFWKIFKI